MKMFIGLALLVSSMTAFSATVKVTSFNYVRSTSTEGRLPLAELCGLVEGATTPQSFLRVLVDPKSNQPGVYNTLAGTDGKFCVAVITYRGTADVTVMGQKDIVRATIK